MKKHTINSTFNQPHQKRYLQAKPNQKVATKAQLRLLAVFLEQGMMFQKRVKLCKWVDFERLLIFLWLCAIKPEGYKMCPNRQIDKIWHDFILCTRQYVEFCEKSAGFYLHHRPAVARFDSGNEYLRPIWLYSWEDIRVFISGKRESFDIRKFYRADLLNIRRDLIIADTPWNDDRCSD